MLTSFTIVMRRAARSRAALAAGSALAMAAGWGTAASQETATVTAAEAAAYATQAGGATRTAIPSYVGERSSPRSLSGTPLGNFGGLLNNPAVSTAATIILQDMVGNRLSSTSNAPQPASRLQPAGGSGGASSSATGARSFSACRSCHTVALGQPNVVGPNLFGVVGRRAGTVPNYKYSDALKRAGIVWTDASLDRWIQSPSTMVPGTKEHFLGLASPQDRANIIAYLKTAQ